MTLFQSTPSQRGRQYALGGCKVFKIISIHALAKRATVSGYDGSDIQGISIHALAKRATYGTKYSAVAICYFNPRPRKEGDAGSYRSAVTRGHFNPRPRKEGDLTVIISFSSLTLFQSTPSQRGRPRMPQSVDVRYLISIHALAKRATVLKKD